MKDVCSPLACNIISRRRMPKAFAREYVGILEPNINHETDFEV